MSNQDPNLSREQEKYENPVPSREFILTHLQERSKPANYTQLCEELAVNDEERQIAFKRRLRAMETVHYRLYRSGYFRCVTCNTNVHTTISDL